MNVAYLSYNALDAPLVHAQVLPYLRKLVEMGHRFVLMTFESKNDIAGKRKPLEHGIDWLPLPMKVGKAGFAMALLRAGREIRGLNAQWPIDLLHARSYVPAVLAYRASRQLDIPWLFDMRGFWIDEKVLKGTLTNDGFPYKLLKRLERKLLQACTGLVSLTERALPRIRSMAGLEKLPSYAVIPTCADLDRFLPSVRCQSASTLRVYGYVGSLGKGYNAVLLASFLEAALNRDPDSRVIIVTRSDEQLLGNLRGEFRDRIEITSAAYDEMPVLMQRMDVGLSFITPDSSKDASCATKWGEYLACGAVIVSNPGIGDVDLLLGAGRVGVSCESACSITAALNELDMLLAEQDIRERCRAWAEQHFSVTRGAQQYHSVYEQLLSARMGEIR